jgi:chloramphenicol-sensitive protein RarD
VNPGLAAAAAAYILWGLLPLYLHQLAALSALDLVLHRCLWSLLFMLALLGAQRRWEWLGKALRQPRLLAVSACSALLLSANWLLYVWAVNNGRVLEASLGYFINPLVNVLLGVVVLHERPRALQWASIGVAVCAVAWLGWTAGSPPWISLALAFSFGFYGLLKKQASLGSIEGLTLETLLLAPLALPALLWLSLQPGNVGPSDFRTWALVLASGPITAIPLLLFGFGAQRIRMATLGLLQYLGPSLQFAIGVWVFHEPLREGRLAGFVGIWASLLLYSSETLWMHQRQRRTAQTA